MRYLGNLSPNDLKLMGHKDKSWDELVKLANRLNFIERRNMNNFIKSWKERNDKTNEA